MELKTKKNDADIQSFIDSVKNETRKKDARVLLEMMREVSGDQGSMWGPSIIGFGKFLYKYKSGRELDWFITGFSPRKQNLTLYIIVPSKKFNELLGDLGKHKTSKGCLYINKLADVDLDVLKALIKESINYLQKKMDEQS